MAMLVRIKPFDAKRGYRTRRYTVFSTRFEESRGWYRVAEEVAEYLKTIHQVPGDEDTPLVFDVCTEEQAGAIDAAEHNKAELRARATNANVPQASEVGNSLSSKDLSPMSARDAIAASAAARSETRANRRAERAG